MRSHIVFTGIVLLSSAVSSADKFDERLRQSGTVMKEVLDMPDSVPLDLLHKAECVVVMPSVKKFAFGIGGSYGAGAMVCRSGKGFNGPWGPPSMYRIDGGNIGFQIGGQATDFILLIMNPKGANASVEEQGKTRSRCFRRRQPQGPSHRRRDRCDDACGNLDLLSEPRFVRRRFLGRLEPATGQ